jgi:ElaB/YqjD/DUF883 family membrane-anchored ribosome-binding protein
MNRPEHEYESADKMTIQNTGQQDAWNKKSSGSTFNQIKTTVADQLHTAADKLQEKSRNASGESEWGNYGNQAANWLNRSADYINDVDVDRVKTDLSNQMRSNPGRSLLIAAAAGLALGVLIRRR